jgi:acyl-CoA synthetase (AMP-forming)/AMP-acid ligase II
MSDAARHPSTYLSSPIMNALKRDRNKPVVEIVGEKPWTGGDLLRRISQLTQALQANGVSGGARVALLAGNSVDVLLAPQCAGLCGRLSGRDAPDGIGGRSSLRHRRWGSDRPHL